MGYSCVHGLQLRARVAATCMGYSSAVTCMGCRYVGKFVSVTFDYEEPEAFIGFVCNKSDERKVGGTPHWCIHFEDNTDQSIPLGNGDWDWEFI